MRTSTKRINTAAKKTVVGVVVLLNISLGLQSVERSLRVKNCEELSEEDAMEIAKKRYTSIIHAGGEIKVASIEKYKPILLGVRQVFDNLKMY